MAELKAAGVTSLIEAEVLAYKALLDQGEMLAMWFLSTGNKQTAFDQLHALIHEAIEQGVVIAQQQPTRPRINIAAGRAHGYAAYLIKRAMRIDRGPGALGSVD